MKISGSELAAQRIAEKKLRARFNYGDLVAFRALKAAETEGLSKTAYYGTCLALNAKFGPHTALLIVFGGISAAKPAASPDLLVLEDGRRSEFDDDVSSVCDPAVIDPQFATYGAEVWKVTFDRSGPPALQLVNQFSLPVSLVGHSMLYYKVMNKVIIYGGANLTSRSLFSSVFVLSMKTLQLKYLKVHKVQPPGRLRHAACLIEDQMYVHGGQSNSSAAIVLEDLWCFNLSRIEWTLLPNRVRGSTDAGVIQTQAEYDLSHGPGKRSGHHMIAFEGCLYVAFGSDGAVARDDVWAYDLKGQYWVRLQLLDHKGEPHPSVCGRIDGAATLVESAGKWIFHGGIGPAGEVLNTIVEVNLRTLEARCLRVEVTDFEDCKSGRKPSSLSSTNCSSPRLLPALRGHALLHIPGTAYSVLMRGVNRYNEYVTNQYLLHFTGVSEMALKTLPQWARPAMNETYVTPMFDTTHNWRTGDSVSLESKSVDAGSLRLRSGVGSAGSPASTADSMRQLFSGTVSAVSPRRVSGEALLLCAKAETEQQRRLAQEAAYWKERCHTLESELRALRSDLEHARETDAKNRAAVLTARELLNSVLATRLNVDQ